MKSGAEQMVVRQNLLDQSLIGRGEKQHNRKRLPLGGGNEQDRDIQ